MSNGAFQALCRRYQAAFTELVPRVDDDGDKAAEARVVRVLSGPHAQKLGSFNTPPPVLDHLTLESKAEPLKLPGRHNNPNADPNPHPSCPNLLQIKLVQEAINLKGWMGATHSAQITHAQARKCGC